MNYIISIITLFALVPLQTLGMFTTFNKPTYWQHKPRFDRNNLTSYELTYTHAWATSSFNDEGNKVSLLNFSNPEPLLPSFLNCHVSDKKNIPVCYGLFDGKYSMDTVHNEFAQNIYKNFYLQVHIPISHDQITNIRITPTDAHGEIIPQTEKIDSYLEKLSKKLFTFPGQRSQERYFVGPLFFFFGYTKSFEDFNHLDMLDFSFKTGIISPVIPLIHPKFSLYPRLEPFNFGIPFELELLIGVYDWLNIGVATTLITFIKNDDILPVNLHPYPNKLIFPDKRMCSLFHYPQINFSTYIEGEYFLPHWTWYVGFSFVKQYKTVWNICSGSQQENCVANKFPTNIGWQQGAITISSEFDFSSDEKFCMPRCRFMYIKRIFGKNCFNSAILVGQVGFELLYDF